MSDPREEILFTDDNDLKWDWRRYIEEKERTRQLAYAAFVEDFWKFKMVGR